MGIWASKRAKKEKETLFHREKKKEKRRKEKLKKAQDPDLKRKGLIETAIDVGEQGAGGPAALAGAGAAAGAVTYGDEALERMRRQLDRDADAFLLNNILLSIQFFENYERETYLIKSGATSEHEYEIKTAMGQHHKQVLFADRIQECVREHVRFSQTRRGQAEPLVPPRVFVVYENVEASKRGELSHYSAVLDAPFYKLQVENSEKPGFVKLKKIEVLESTVIGDGKVGAKPKSVISDRSSDTDSYESPTPANGQALLDEIRTNIQAPIHNLVTTKTSDMIIENNSNKRRNSGPTKYVKSVMANSNINNIYKLYKTYDPLEEMLERNSDENKTEPDAYAQPRKSAMKNGNHKKINNFDGEIKYEVHFNVSDGKDNDNLLDDTETLGSRSTSSSRQNESSETESDYGYSTLTDLSTPKPIERFITSDLFNSSGVISNECWTEVQIVNSDIDDDDEDQNITSSENAQLKTLYETCYFLSSTKFMKYFADTFINKLGQSLGFCPDEIDNALTQGASIYCNTIQNGMNVGYEIMPALYTAWPEVADEWIIRKRKIVQNPRTNYRYQWLTRNMINKTINYGCVLIPVGFRAKRGLNTEQQLQWKIAFPAAEHYLESRLAHSQMRCYLFALALLKCFNKDESVKLGIDASHLKNHLFWECEDNYAKWPEDRPGETLRSFLKKFYGYLSKAQFPNYFVESCNDFEGIPKPLLRSTQKHLAEVLESPVMHMLNVVQKFKYTSKNFYPRFSYYRLYHILTCSNPLKILNPNLNISSSSIDLKSESDDEDTENVLSFGEREKSQDKQYLWIKRKYSQSLETHRRLSVAHVERQKTTPASERNIDRHMIVPKKLDPVRRRLVLELFIPHFIEMARCSEKFEATSQALIYLEHAQRLCMLLLQEPSGETTGQEFLDTIREMIAELQRKLVRRNGYTLLSKPKSQAPHHLHFLGRQESRSLDTVSNLHSPIDAKGAPAFNFVEDRSNETTKDFVLKESDIVLKSEEVSVL